MKENLINVNHTQASNRQKEQFKFIQLDRILNESDEIIFRNEINQQEKIDNGKKKILAEITEARNRLLKQDMDSAIARRTYAIEFDIAAYDVLKTYIGSPGYIEAKEELDLYTEFQLQTMLGERFHTGLSSYKCNIKEGKIYAGGMNEPMVSVLERGRDFRKLNGSTELEREYAEVVGFQNIQEVLTNEQTPDGTKMLSFSLPGKEGSIYAKNFYDIFEKCTDLDGESIIKVNRYSSKLSKSDVINKIKEIDKTFDLNQNIDDAFLLAHPLTISSENSFLQSAEDLHKFLHKEHELISSDDFTELINENKKAREIYLEQLLNSPESVHIVFNGLINNADNIRNLMLHKKKNQEINNLESNSIDMYQNVRINNKDDIFVLGKLPVNQISTGCGMSSGYAVSGPGMIVGGSPYSVGFFGTEQVSSCKECGLNSSDNHYHCPKDLKDKNGNNGCGRRYADETSKAERTKECTDCGFKFNC